MALAHSMGGLVARAALAPPPPSDREGVADIRGLVTLATPHEGAPLASREAAEVLKALRPAALSAVVLAGLGRQVELTLFLTSILSLTVDGPSVGLKDAAFDSPGFTDYNGNPGNPDLASLRQREANRQLHARQIAFAGKLDSFDFVDAIFRDLNFGLETDFIVPVTSARFTRVSAQGGTFQGVNHVSILDMRANANVFAAVKSALLGFLPLPPPPPPPPGQGTWSATGSLATGRSSHTATRLLTGKVLVVGGFTDTSTGNAIDSADLFDPAANGGVGAWTPTGSLAIARLYHTATFLPTGKVLVVAISPAWRAFSDSYCREPSRRNGEGEKGPAIS